MPAKRAATSAASSSKAAKKGKTTQGRPKVTPLLPDNAVPVNQLNRLELITEDMREDPTRPWFILDHVDPAPKFRVRPAGFTGDFIEEGEGEELFDNPAPNRVPVVVPGYQ